MSRLRDGVGQVIARRVRRAAFAKGHLLNRFRASKDNSFANKLGDTFYAECAFCGKPVLINFQPFDNEEEEARSIVATSKRFGSTSEIRYCVSGLDQTCKGRAP